MERPTFKEKPLAGAKALVTLAIQGKTDMWPAGTQVMVIQDVGLDTGESDIRDHWVPVMKLQDLKGFDPDPKDPVGKAILIDKFNNVGDFARWCPSDAEGILPAEIVPMAT